MDRKIASEIVEAGEFEGMEIRLREDYSGRGMMGEKTAAVICDDNTDFAAAVGRTCVDSDDADNLIDAVSRCRQDSMGKQVIFY